MEIPKVGRTGRRVGREVAKVRAARGLEQRQLSDLTAEAGKHLAPSVLSKLEHGNRRVDVDDLVVLAVALGVTPNRLLCGGWDSGVEETGGRSEVHLTETVVVPARDVQLWAAGEKTISMNGDTAVYPQRPGRDPLIDSLKISEMKAIENDETLRVVAHAVATSTQIAGEEKTREAVRAGFAINALQQTISKESKKMFVTVREFLSKIVEQDKARKESDSDDATGT